MEDKNSVLKASLRRLLSNVFDLFMLNLLWIICSLPVLTMGPATSALFSVELKLVREEPVKPITEFFRAFKANFKQAFLLGLIAFAGAVVAYFDFQYAMTQEGSIRTVFFIVTGILAALWLIFTSYTIPLQARFDNTIKGHIKNAFALTIVAPGKTVSMWLIYAFPILALIVFPEISIIYLGWLYLLYGVSLPLYWTSRILNTIFNKLSKTEGEAENET